MAIYRVLVCFVLVSGYVASSGSARATMHPSGKEFYSFCTVTTETPNGDAFFARCENYVEEIRMELSKNELHGLRACIPKSVSSLRLITASIEWMDVDETRHHLESDEALARAFAERWPCD